MLKLKRAFFRNRNFSHSGHRTGDLDDIYRFSLVYALLGLLLLLGSNGVFGSVQTTHLSLEKFEPSRYDGTLPVFGTFYLDRSIYKGSFETAADELTQLVNARESTIEQIRNQEQTEMNRLKAEHGNLFDFSKWKAMLFSNIGQQAVLKSSADQKIAAWDTKNFIRVKSIEKNGKKFLVSIQVVRNSRDWPVNNLAVLP